MAATLANINRGKNTAPYTPADFMPWHETTESEKAEQQGGTEDERDNLFRMMGGL